MSDTENPKELEAVATTNLVVVDMGSLPDQQIAQLKKGTGDLATEVSEIVDDIVDRLKATAGEKVFIPVVVLYERGNA